MLAACLSILVSVCRLDNLAQLSFCYTNYDTAKPDPEYYETDQFYGMEDHAKGDYIIAFYMVFLHF